MMDFYKYPLIIGCKFFLLQTTNPTHFTKLNFLIKFDIKF